MLDSRIKEAIVFVHKNLDKKITLKNACRISNLSPSRFCELFRHETKTSLFKFIIKTRIERACELLQKSSLSIKQISYEVSYRYRSNFNRDFKKLVGISPSEYIKKRVILKWY